MVCRLDSIMTNPLVTYVKFLAPFPHARGQSDDTAGADIVRRFSEQLSGSEIIVYSVERTGVWNWKIRAGVGRLYISTVIGVVDDVIPGPINQWDAMHRSNLRLPWKLLPYSMFRNRHIEHHEHYCKTFCEIVESTEGIGNVVWYNTISMGIRSADMTSD